MMKGVILMAYGTPRSLDEVQAYYTNIRGGRTPPESDVANLVERYRAIGGTSPLIRITESLRDGLQRRISNGGSETRVYTAMKHSPPFIADVVAGIADDGVDQLLSIALAPHYSRMSTGTYMLAVELANDALPRKMKLDSVLSWHDNPLLIEAWAERIRQAEKGLPADYSLIFSAHSLPVSILAQGDPYRDQLLGTAEAVASRLGRKEWSFAFQSASHTREPWLGPDILDHMQSLLDKGAGSFLIAPIGFVSDHLEILYDIDVECRKWAKDRGVRLARCESFNDSDELIACLQSLIAGKQYL
ncbi:MAG: ferrochelatase [Nitrososphaerales archaeon]|jgi:ferrochelatase